MNRHRTYGSRDDTPEPDRDPAFRGVNSLIHPSLLTTGFVSHAVNCRFDEGPAATRRGLRIMPWGAPGYQAADPSRVLPYGDVLLAEAYTDPITHKEWLIIVSIFGAWKASPGSTGSPIPVAPGESTDFATDLIQTYTGMVMLRGANHAPLYMRNVDEGFMVLPPADSGKEQLPPSTFGIYFQNRIFVIDAREDQVHSDTVWVSDFGAGGSTLQGDPTYQSFRINQGSSDRLVALAKFNETTLIAAKSKSIYVVTNIFGTNQELAENARLDEITRAYGCRAARSWIQVGKDLWFMGHERGVCSIRQTETNALQGVDVPVSRDIQPYIDRINWEYADDVVAGVHDNRVFFAVPIDGSKTNNAVLVYSLLTQAWAGYDFSQATKVKDFVQFTYGGAVRLGYVSTDGFIYLYEDGYTDHVGNEAGQLTYLPIETTVRTRGYLGNTRGNKTGLRASARVLAWEGRFSVKSLPDGFQEEEHVDEILRDSTRYIRPHDKPDWDPVNAAGDWDTPWREDYSLMPDGTQVTDPVTGAGTVAFNVLQETEETWNLKRTRCQHAQLEFASDRGRMELHSVAVESIRGDTRSKSHA